MRSLLLACMLVTLYGCTAIKAAVSMHRDTDDFLVLEQDPRVRYQAGAEASARIVSAGLDEAIALIEARQYTPFAKPVVIHVTASEDDFGKYCVSGAGGCVLNERLFISPKKENSKERIPRVLAHELSHLHMEQTLGMWKWNANVPAWFREGLAVYASNGSGAENVSEAQARRAIASGESLTPNPSGSLLFPKTASRFGLEQHMYYRQAGLFVGWLHEQGDDRFRKLLQGIRSDQAFEQAVTDAYGAGIQDNWSRFLMDVSNKRAGILN